MAGKRRAQNMIMRSQKLVGVDGGGMGGRVNTHKPLTDCSLHVHDFYLLLLRDHPPLKRASPRSETIIVATVLQWPPYTQQQTLVGSKAVCDNTSPDQTHPSSFSGTLRPQPAVRWPIQALQTQSLCISINCAFFNERLCTSYSIVFSFQFFWDAWTGNDTALTNVQPENDILDLKQRWKHDCVAVALFQQRQLSSTFGWQRVYV